MERTEIIYEGKQRSAVHTKPAKKKKSKKSSRKKKLLIVLGVIFALFFIYMGFGHFTDDSPNGALQPVDTVNGRLNVLLLGVDEAGLRTDAIMLASYDFPTKQIALLSVPRDTKFYVKDRDVTRKINEIHAMHDSKNNLLGAMGSIKAVTALTNIPIHYYLEFSFDAIDELADTIGPITFDVPDIEGNGKGMNYEDPAQDLYIHLKPGVQELSGNQVQQFLRYRKSNSGTTDGSDTSRVARQQEFLKAAADQKLNIGLIPKIPGIYSKLKKEIKTNFSAGEMVKYAKYIIDADLESIQTYQLPGTDKRLSKGWYFVCDLEETAELINEVFGVDTSDITTEITVEDVKGSKSNSYKKSESKSSSSENLDGTVKQEKKKTEEEATPTPETKETAKPTEKPKETEPPEEKTKETAKPTEAQKPSDSKKGDNSQDSGEEKKSTPEPTEEPRETEPEEKAASTASPNERTPDDVVSLD